MAQPNKLAAKRAYSIFELLSMQEAEQMLQSFSLQLENILQQLDGAMNMDAAHQPLALTALLSAMAPGATVSLATSQHPVIQVGGSGEVSSNQCCRLETAWCIALDLSASTGLSPSALRGAETVTIACQSSRAH